MGAIDATVGAAFSRAFWRAIETVRQSRSKGWYAAHGDLTP